MNLLSRKIMQVALISVFATPLSVLAADKADNDHDSHHPAQAQSANAPEKAAPDANNKIRENMQARMLAMHNTTDPEARQAMMMAQMDDMAAMMANMGSGCPMMGGGQGGMMGGGKGGKGGMMGSGMPGNPAK